MAGQHVARGPQGAAALDCTACGACCFSRSATYLGVFACDLERLASNVDRVTVVLHGNRYMRIGDGCCVALRWDPARGFVCAIYASRPDVCRALVPGSAQCLDDRRDKASAAEAWRASTASPKVLPGSCAAPSMGEGAAGSLGTSQSGPRTG